MISFCFSFFSFEANLSSEQFVWKPSTVTTKPHILAFRPAPSVFCFAQLARSHSTTCPEHLILYHNTQTGDKYPGKKMLRDFLPPSNCSKPLILLGETGIENQGLGLSPKNFFAYSPPKQALKGRLWQRIKPSTAPAHFSRPSSSVRTRSQMAAASGEWVTITRANFCAVSDESSVKILRIPAPVQ